VFVDWPRYVPLITTLPVLTFPADDLANTLDLSRLSTLQTLRIGGLQVPKTQHIASVFEGSLPSILQRIESSFLERVELHFNLTPDSDAAFQSIDWRHLERVLLTLHFFGMKTVSILVEMSAFGDSARRAVGVERAVRASMADLDARGVLQVRAFEEAQAGEGCQGSSPPTFCLHVVLII